MLFCAFNSLYSADISDAEVENKLDLIIGTMEAIALLEPSRVKAIENNDKKAQKAYEYCYSKLSSRIGELATPIFDKVGRGDGLLRSVHPFVSGPSTWDVALNLNLRNWFVVETDSDNEGDY